MVVYCLWTTHVGALESHDSFRIKLQLLCRCKELSLPHPNMSPLHISSFDSYLSCFKTNPAYLCPHTCQGHRIHHLWDDSEPPSHSFQDCIAHFTLCYRTYHSGFCRKCETEGRDRQAYICHLKVMWAWEIFIFAPFICRGGYWQPASEGYCEGA